VKFLKFYKWGFDAESGFTTSGRLFETMGNENSLSRLYWSDSLDNGVSITIYNIKNDNGLVDINYPRTELMEGMIEISEDEFILFKRELAEDCFVYVDIFIKLLSTGSLYSCYENDDSYLIFLTDKRLLLKGTKYDYNFEFEDHENYRFFYFEVVDEDHYLSDILNDIETKGFKKITKDPLSIYGIWQKFIPDIGGLHI
jgi:hypothetical protein